MPDIKHSGFFEWPAVSEIVKQVLSGEVTAQEQVKKSLQLISDLNPRYNAVLSVIEERSLERAKKIDESVANNQNPGRLAGVPFIAKDNYLTFGSETTAASNMLKGFNAPYQSTVIEMLEREGAICVAKANLDAFAHGGSTENSDYMVTKNPHDESRVAGGSSGGSAAAVALGLAPFALGSDTGGSIRQPGSFCGVVGYKPTYGLVSRSGVVAMASSTDVMGPLTRTVQDAAMVLDCIAGIDPLDATTIERDLNSYANAGNTGKSLKEYKVGIISECFGEGNSPGVLELVNKAVNDLKKAGVTAEAVSLPTLDAALAVYYVVIPAELSSNLSRHDGQRFQFSAPDTNSLEESYVQSRSRGFGMEAKRRIMIGTHVLSSGYYDAYYKKAQTVRTKIINEFNGLLEEYDFLITPTAPTTAFKIGELTEDPLAMYMQDYNSVGVSLAGLPAITLPCGISETDKMPVGMQIIGRQKGDLKLLEFANLYEEIKK